MANFKFNWKKIQLAVTQATTAAPALTAMNSADPNSAGFGTLTPARTSTGLYTITSSGTPFTAGKTIVTVAPLSASAAKFPIVKAVVTSTSVITITTIDAATGVQAVSDDLLNGVITIEIAQS